MTHRLSWLRLAAAFCVAGAAWSAAPAHAGMFDDNEARRAVLDLRSKSDNLANQLSAAQRTILDQTARLDQLNQQVATLRGENEDLTNRLTTLERQQKEYYTDLDTRLKKFEPQQKTVDGVEGTVQPGETDAFNTAQQQFRDGNFKAAAASFRSFIAKYPQSPYQPTAQYWLGNAQYALRDYKGSTATWQGIVGKYPQHPRAADAMLAIGTNQLEQGQKAAAKKTFEQVVSQYSGSSAAQTAQGKLQTMK
ncbi:tol-pal system protein YbgF [Burkholderia stagnalis]|uniref:Cell division coordinator CpoB n=1 Tax=Burkholderia stagnalis TaxID=1503054 RepID=A0ABX9YSR8_9BURK|nr:tol-pal system protein YbgF [Burkholderia stagnalis]RQQ61917.1 tol-pal system protein YbgF [Burkholderia stagnalis]RQQ71833.1 tol-pal system protein YbgF [Burkholderia stagnalis]RQQ73026.1 tol-pal system protein YbgF [Burkholderia stagnalis]RQQ84621.1 tol-pal system protein YbgF [Burkholderia stagnalis]RQQ92363.1 tol-pal system protein YbgF [Burkholderia stagnalis]